MTARETATARNARRHAQARHASRMGALHHARAQASPRSVRRSPITPEKNVGLIPASARVYAPTIGLPLSMVALPQASAPLHWALGAVPIVFPAAVLASARRPHESLDDESHLSSPMFIDAPTVVGCIQWRHALHGCKQSSYFWSATP